MCDDRSPRFTKSVKHSESIVGFGLDLQNSREDVAAEDMGAGNVKPGRAPTHRSWVGW
jgi:hypothetical protein